MSDDKHPVPAGTGCRGKIRYNTKRLAQGVLRVMQQKGQPKSDTLHAYRCASCGKWHLGNKSGSVPAPLKTVRAAAGEIVEIVWQDGKHETRTRHEAPKKMSGSG